MALAPELISCLPPFFFFSLGHDTKLLEVDASAEELDMPLSALQFRVARKQILARALSVYGGKLDQNNSALIAS